MGKGASKETLCIISTTIYLLGIFELYSFNGLLTILKKNRGEINCKCPKGDLILYIYKRCLFRRNSQFDVAQGQTGEPLVFAKGNPPP